MTTTPSTARPTAPRERHRLVDVLRGFALLGLIVVNAEFIFNDVESGWSSFTGSADTVAQWVSATFFQQKFYLLFSLLFGYGLSLQLSRSAKGASDLWPRYRRRMIGLLTLGVGHAIFFFVGDILVLYAIVGALAYLFRHHPTAALLRLALGTYMVIAALLLLAALLTVGSAGAAPTPDAGAVDAYSDGGFGEVIGQHLSDWLFIGPLVSLVQGPPAFALFVVGIALGRTDLLSNVERHRPVAMRVAVAAGGVGLFGSMLAGWLLVTGEEGGGLNTLGFALQYLFAPLLSAGYVAVLALALGSRPTWLVAPLEAAGRMSLTVYLLESVVASTLAYSYGFGLFGDIGPLENFAVAFAIWAALCALSMWWLRWARFGPFEWLLRSWTYRRPMPLRHRDTSHG